MSVEIFSFIFHLYPKSVLPMTWTILNEQKAPGKDGSDAEMQITTDNTKMGKEAYF